MSRQPGEQTADEPYLVLRIDHLFAPYKDEDACRAIADIFARPCFEPLAHLELSPLKGKTFRHGPLTSEVFLEFIADPRCELVNIDSGQRGSHVAFAHLATGRLNEQHKGSDIFPEVSGVSLPSDSALLSHRLDAFCALAVQLRTLVGCVSLEPNWSMANVVKSGITPPPLARSLEMPDYTERRVRERSAYSDYDLPLDRELWGPEWGLFLSRGHVARVPVQSLDRSGAFSRVERLTDDLVYLQITDDPMDTLRDDYDEMLDPARHALAPILTDLSRVIVE